MMIVETLRKYKNGRKIADYSFNILVNHICNVLKKTGLQDNMAVLSYGSAGGKFLVSVSDTDFTFLDDGSLSEARLLKFQDMVYEEFSKYSWAIAIKTWERVKVNPMDLLSLHFLGGNRAIFEKEVIENREIMAQNNKDVILSTLAGVGLHLEFMSSGFFSRLVRKYHPLHEFPVEICYGDIKYFKGGLRWCQQIEGIAMLLSEKRFLSDSTIDILLQKGCFTGKDAETLNSAVDFMLAAKDLCVEGNNIFFEKNLQVLKNTWEQGADEITSEYNQHTENVKILFYKALQFLFDSFPDHEGVRAVVVKEPVELRTLIATNKLEIWKNIALRNDISNEIRDELRGKIMELQESRPHTMLDEMLVMLDFASGKPLDKKETEAEREQWLTEHVFNHFRKILGNNINQPELISHAVHGSFFELYKQGKYPNPKLFSELFIDRAKRFFHCSTLEPEKPLEIVKSACFRLLNSGLFHVENIVFLELHLTNHCNLNCSWCTYKARRDNQSLPFAAFQQISEFSPAEILIVGGGEPTLYQDDKHGFNEAVAFLGEKLPGTRLRLITNGVVIPKGDWLNKLDELSISLDDGCEESFARNKGRNLFFQVWNNICKYLFDSNLSLIRITKIYNRQNILDSFNLAEKLFELWKKLPPYSAKKKNFKFMLFQMADDNNAASPYGDTELSNEKKEMLKNKLRQVRYENEDFYYFLQNNTNISAITEENLEVRSADHCWNVVNYLLLGADGKIYPCFATCSCFKATTIENINQSKKEIKAGRENLFSFPPLRCRQGCRPGSVFYGQRTKQIFRGQKQMNIPTLEACTKTGLQIIHVSYQSPDNLLGGIGWAVYNLCKSQVKTDRLVYWISPCIKDEQEGEFMYENGLLRVIKVRFCEEKIVTFFSNDPNVHKQRIKFADFFVNYIANNFNPANCVIHLHGFIEIPRRADELKKMGFNVVSTFHMLLSSRNAAIGTDLHLLDDLRQSEQKAIRENSVITVPSVGMKDELLKICSEYKGIIHCVKNGISDEHFITPLQSIPAKEKLIISYGRISQEKGFDLFIAASKLLINKINKQKDLPLKFLVFGNTDFSIDSRRIYAEQLIQSSGNYPNIEIRATRDGITGLLKINLIDQSAFAVVPSLYEPFGMVIPEIMSRAKPVITTLTDGAKEIMKTNKIGRNDFGIIIEPTPDSLAIAMNWLLTHHEEAIRMGKNAFERAKNYRWDDVAKQFDDLYVSSL
jgi:glycosyltransferase involved in cell wall biosynthesis/MoaA/NifB/PqqE/SkfB family radical SAM enzyme